MITLLAKISTAFAALALLAFFPSRSWAAPSFDCTKATTPVESLICSNIELGDLDGRMGQAFRDLRQKARKAQLQSLMEEQRSWLKWRIKKCAIASEEKKYSEDEMREAVDCLSEIYRGRLVRLGHLAHPGKLEGKVGKYIQIWMSANDEVCGKVFKSLEGVFSNYEENTMVEIKDDAFAKWEVDKLIIPREKRGEFEPISTARADIDNDGTIDLLVRTTRIGKRDETIELLSVYSPDDYPFMMDKNIYYRDLASTRAKWRVNFFSPGQGDDKTIPKTDYHGHYRLEESATPSNIGYWYNDDRGKINIIKHKYNYYYVFYMADGPYAGANTFRNYKGQFYGGGGAAWGGVVLFHPDGRADSICQFQPKGMPSRSMRNIGEQP